MMVKSLSLILALLIVFSLKFMTFSGCNGYVDDIASSGDKEEVSEEKVRTKRAEIIAKEDKIASITPGAGEIEKEKGSELELEVEPEEDYELKEWIIDGEKAGTERKQKELVLSKDKEIEILLEKKSEGPGEVGGLDKPDKPGESGESGENEETGETDETDETGEAEEERTEEERTEEENKYVADEVEKELIEALNYAYTLEERAYEEGGSEEEIYEIYRKGWTHEMAKDWTDITYDEELGTVPRGAGMIEPIEIELLEKSEEEALLKYSLPGKAYEDTGERSVMRGTMVKENDTWLVGKTELLKLMVGDEVRKEFNKGNG